MLVLLKGAVFKDVSTNTVTRPFLLKLTPALLHVSVEAVSLIVADGR